MRMKFSDLPKADQDKMRDEITRVALCVIESMHFNGQANNLTPYVVLCGYMHGIAVYANLHTEDGHAGDLVERITGYFRDAVEEAQAKIAEVQAEKATTQ